MHFRIILGPPPKCCRLRRLIADCPLRIPIAPGDLRTEPRNSSRTDRAHTACPRAAEGLLLVSIFTKKTRYPAGFGLFIRSPVRTRPSAARATAIVFGRGYIPTGRTLSQSSLYPKCGKYCWEVRPAETYADHAGVAPSGGGACCRPVISQK